MAATSSSVSATVLICWQSLDHAVACQHTSIDGKVPANHERTHCCILLCQPVGFIGEICLIFSPIHQDQTSKPRGTPVRLVQGITPSSASTQALQICHVEATHCVVVFVQPSEIFQIDQEQNPRCWRECGRTVPGISEDDGARNWKPMQLSPISHIQGKMHTVNEVYVKTMMYGRRRRSEEE